MTISTWETRREAEKGPASISIPAIGRTAVDPLGVADPPAVGVEPRHPEPAVRNDDEGDGEGILQSGAAAAIEVVDLVDHLVKRRQTLSPFLVELTSPGSDLVPGDRNADLCRAFAVQDLRRSTASTRPRSCTAWRGR